MVSRKAGTQPFDIVPIHSDQILEQQDRYCLPDSEVIDAYSKDVATQIVDVLGEQFMEHDFSHELAAMITLVLEIHLASRNEDAALDIHARGA